MKKKQLTADAAVENIVPKKVKASRSASDLPQKFFIASLVLGLVALIVILIAQNAINGTGYFQLKLFKSLMKKPLTLDVKFLTSFSTSIVALVISVASLICGVLRNVIKRQNNLIGYIVGLVVTVISVFALLAVHYAA